MNFRKSAVETTATITDIRIDYNEDDTYYMVFVSFTVGGAVAIYYEVGNPSNFRGNGGQFLSYVLVAMVEIFFLTGIALLRKILMTGK